MHTHTIKYYDAIPFENGGGEVDKKDGTILEFLHGSHSFQGVWFGDKHPTFKGDFWWREFLPTDQFISSSQEGQGWIAVEDGLPKEDGNGNIPCLCWDDYHKQTRVLCYNEYHKCWDDESGDDYYTDAVGGKVTHYQPLPLPPKK